MSDGSAVVARAEDAVREADEGKVPPSAEVEAQEQVSDADNAKGASKAAKAVGAKPAAKPAKEKTEKPAKERKSSKYDDATKALAKRAREIRQRDNAIAPVTCQRVLAVLSKSKTTPEEVIKSFSSKKDATAYAGGDREIKAPDLVKELGEKTSDPFARGRGMVSVALAQREVEAKK